ncbi:hypothetical protein FSP39_013369 [Pinctada imbricata]|uniref:Uncharacterized protein n=1 Tax=Pinctada imbricata TaxID=66713 RepID=A0AA88XCZ7_PINIB|nr:hypothetical protein FSP39_013369 [Pinctada imbricata]
MSDLVKFTKSVQQDAKIIVSLPPNRGDDPDLNYTTKIVNASVKISFQSVTNVFVCDNSNLAYRGERNRKLISRDEVHPTEFGEKILFQNIRRAIEEVCEISRKY